MFWCCLLLRFPDPAEEVLSPSNDCFLISTSHQEKDFAHYTELNTNLLLRYLQTDQRVNKVKPRELSSFIQLRITCNFKTFKMKLASKTRLLNRRMRVNFDPQHSFKTAILNLVSNSPLDPHNMILHPLAFDPLFLGSDTHTDVHTDICTSRDRCFFALKTF